MSLSKHNGFTQADTVDGFNFLLRYMDHTYDNFKSALILAGVIVGTVYTIKATIKLMRFFHLHFLIPMLWEKHIRVKTCGNWAVVYGATEHLGNSFVEYCASNGFNIILICYDNESLHKMKISFEKMYKVKTEYIKLDVSEPIQQFQRVTKIFGRKEIGMLINNWPAPGDSSNGELISGTSEVKLSHLALLNKLVISKMKAKYRGAIITSSYSELDTTGSKYTPEVLFIQELMRQNYFELARWGITVQLFQPYRKAILFSKDMEKPINSNIIPSSTHYVTNSMKMIGFSFSTTGHWSHSILTTMYTMMPDWGRPMFKNYVNSTLEKYQD